MCGEVENFTTRQLLWSFTNSLLKIIKIDWTAWVAVIVRQSWRIFLNHSVVVFQFIFCDKLALLALFVILVCRRLYIFKPRNSIHFQLPAERSLAGNLLSASDEDPLYCLSRRLWARMQCTGRSAAMPPVIRIYVTERWKCQQNAHACKWVKQFPEVPSVLCNFQKNVKT